MFHPTEHHEGNIVKTKQPVMEAIDTERGYNSGWNAYHDGKLLDDNTFDLKNERDLHEGYNSGWTIAQLQDNSYG